MKHTISDIVKSGLCIGCGACVAACKGKLAMEWSEYGFLHPLPLEEYTPGEEVKVCPFNPYPENEVLTEDELAPEAIPTATKTLDRVGRYTATYCGYSNKYRETSSSGGIATYVQETLLSRGLVDAIATVIPCDEAPTRFDFRLITNVEELRSGSKTKYYPVTYASVLREIEQFDGKVAITGVGCFVKSIRLLQHYHPLFRERIAFVIGIICGGVKSAFFSDYLAQCAGVKGEYALPNFRVKDPDSTATDYSYSCIDVSNKIKHLVKMRTVGDMWGSGYFKALSCDVCDDVTTELADISLGDAWLPQYQHDGKGQNVIVSRSEIADDIIRSGIECGDLAVEEISMEVFLRSQRGSYNHRHKGLRYRVSKLRKAGIAVPPKRYDTEKTSLPFSFVQKYRAKTRSQSLKNWKKTKELISFKKAMRPYDLRLKLSTELYHTKRLTSRLMRKLKRITP